MRAILAAGLVTIFACTGADSSPTTSLDFDFPDPPPELETVQCEDLLFPHELRELLGAEPDVVLKDKSSCFWLTGPDRFQIVINTSRFVDRWRGEILATYTDLLTETEPAIWRAGTSLAIFAEDRGMLVHGVEDADVAEDLLRLAFSRLR